jgi:hypothetical protein
MRKVLLATMAATLLVTMLGGPATAEPVDKTVSFPDYYTFDGWNPCTEEWVTTDYVGRVDIHALPSIEALFSGDWTHLTLKFIGQFVGSDGYETQEKHWGTWVYYVPEGDPPHVVVNEEENIVYSSDDGGKYKVSIRFHITVVDGELKTEMDRFDARCIQYPG